jgi:diaminohydroxyphosphoribosylaminopyrimidine deaminase/5-amino-6-(5-phosphoribosylamino)uracil reductase
VAATLDGKIATAGGDSHWVTSAPSRQVVHRLRDQVDAVMVGFNTALQDDPRLTTRLPGGRGRDPLRVILDSHLCLPLSLKLFTQKSATVIATLESLQNPRAQKLCAQGVQVWSIGSRRGRVDLKALLRRLAEEGYLHLMVEGGAELFASFLTQRLADELVLFVAPKVIGRQGLTWSGPLGVSQMGKALRVKELEAERCGVDLLLRAKL